MYSERWGRERKRIGKEASVLPENSRQMNAFHVTTSFGLPIAMKYYYLFFFLLSVELKVASSFLLFQTTLHEHFCAENNLYISDLFPWGEFFLKGVVLKGRNTFMAPDIS